MDYKEFHKSSLIHLAWLFGHSEGFNVMVGIMFCYRNRVKNDDWDSVLSSAFRDISYNPPPADMIPAFDTRDPEFAKILIAVEQVYEGSRADITSGCTYFTSWPKTAYVTKIGNLYFYKE